MSYEGRLAGQGGVLMVTSKTIRRHRSPSQVEGSARLCSEEHAGSRRVSSEAGGRDDRLARLGGALVEVAHQVRGPLGAIQLYARLLEQQSGDQESSERLVRKILTGVVSLSALVEDLFLFAESDSLKREPCYLLDIQERALEFAQPYLEEKGVCLIRLYAGALQEVQADPRLLSSVFLNIILNAVQAMPVGGELIVSLRGGSRPGEVQEARFEDSGPGFSPEALEHLFEPFYTEKSTGVGLGLAVAHRIVRGHGGFVEVANRTRGGAVVTVHVPPC